MNRRFFFFGVGASALAPRQALANECQASWQQCDPVPDNSFQRGTDKSPADCTLEFRLLDELLTRQGIVRADGSYEWTLRMITFYGDGRPRWQQAHRVVNQPVRQQGVYFGTVGATYITCDEYTGWYTTGPIRSCIVPVFRRVNWPFDWEELEQMTS